MTAPETFTIEGRTVSLPVTVRDATTCFASFLVPMRAARDVVGDDRVPLVAVLPGWAMLSIAVIEYRENDLGRYDELAIAFVARTVPGRSLPIVGATVDGIRGRIGSYIHRLPVTTSFSCEAGRRIWGLPKTVEDLVLTESDDVRRAELRAGGRAALTLEVRMAGTRSFGETPLAALACLDGLLRVTPFRASGTGLGVRLGGATVALGPGEHPIADELRRLGLPRRAVMSGAVRAMRAVYDPAHRFA